MTMLFRIGVLIGDKLSLAEQAPSSSRPPFFFFPLLPQLTDNFTYTKIGYVGYECYICKSRKYQQHF